jgi:hypothetical protein
MCLIPLNTQASDGGGELVVDFSDELGVIFANVVRSLFRSRFYILEKLF